MNFKLVILSLIFFLSHYVTAQTQTILEAPDTWRSELINFPLSFAPEIDLQGFEDIRFSPGWSDSTSSQFWTYTFVWNIEMSKPFNQDQLTSIFNQYFDGLSQVVDPVDPNQPNPNRKKTESTFTKTDDGFTGKITMYDAFFSKKPITLHLKVEELRCDTLEKSVIRFDLSPKPFQHEVWDVFQEVKISMECI